MPCAALVHPTISERMQQNWKKVQERAKRVIRGEVISIQATREWAGTWKRGE